MRGYGLYVLAALGTACGGKTSTLHAFEISGDIPASGEGFANALFQSVDATMAPGHTIQRLDNGALFDALVADIEKAHASIDIVEYIWERGAASTRLVEAIVARARNGVACRIAVDGLGSTGFLTKIAPPLFAAGCQVRVLRPLPDHSALRRDHRKIVVIDGVVAYTGGHCVRDEWLGDGVQGWRDTSVRFTGPAVRQAHQAFAENWQEAGGALLPVTAFPAQPSDGATRIAFVASTASQNITRAERLTLLAIAAAHHRLWVTNAYFVPSNDVVKLLEQKAASGVDVRLLVPGDHDDSKVALVGQRRLYARLGKAGVRVWEYQPSMIHSKTIVVDDRLAIVGSINMDPLSLNELDDAAIVVDDQAFAEGLAEAFTQDVTHAVIQTDKH